MPATVIRRAAPQDAPFLAWAMIEAERGPDPQGEWDVVLPGSADDRARLLARIATREPVHYCHWSRFQLAEREGVPVGAISGYVAARHTWAHFERAFRGAFRAAGLGPDDAQTAWLRFAPFSVVHVSLPEEAWRVEWVAVRPEQRGRGIVGELLAANLERARSEGCREAIVTAALENEPARRAYEAAGFAPFARWEHDDYRRVSGSAGNVVMRRAL